MNPELLKILLKKKQLNANKLAKLLNLSRETVSRWLRSSKKINLRADHLLALSQILNIELQVLLSDVDQSILKNLRKFETIFNWDRSYSSVVEFVLAVLNWDYNAMARLVQVKGFYVSAKLLGIKNITPLIDRYPYYRKFIHPKKRELLDRSYHYLCNPI